MMVARSLDAPYSAPTRWHELKTDPVPFDEVAAGRKTFELRRDDRDFQAGDGLRLRRTRYTGQQMQEEGMPLIYEGEPIERRVTHVIKGPAHGLAEGWAVLSLAPKDPAAVGERLAAVTRERDEADRRAGAAERRLEDAHEGALRRAMWLRGAKKQAGYDENTSFDIVWDEALAALIAARGATPQPWPRWNLWAAAVDDALVAAGLDCTTPQSDPRETVRRLVDWSVLVALDPAVSAPAAALVRRGAEQAAKGSSTL